MSSDEPKKYKVGKGKPPKHSQFKPGESGNPNGRPKGSRNTKQVLTKILNEKITMTESGQKMVVDKEEAMHRVLVQNGLHRGHQSLKLYFDVKRDMEGTDTAATEKSFDEDDYAALMEELDWIEKVRDAAKAELSDGTE